MVTESPLTTHTDQWIEIFKGIYNHLIFPIQLWTKPVDILLRGVISFHFFLKFRWKAKSHDWITFGLLISVKNWYRILKFTRNVSGRGIERADRVRTRWDPGPCFPLSPASCCSPPSYWACTVSVDLYTQSYPDYWENTPKTICNSRNIEIRIVAPLLNSLSLFLFPPSLSLSLLILLNLPFSVSRTTDIAFEFWNDHL